MWSTTPCQVLETNGEFTGRSQLRRDSFFCDEFENALHRDWEKLGTEKELKKIQSMMARAENDLFDDGLLDHLEKFPGRPNNATPIKRAAYSLSFALDIDQNSAEQKLMDFLLKHQEEWNLFIDYLGNKSFITKFLE